MHPSGPPLGGHSRSLMTLFLCGDVMTGRGIDQLLPHPSDPKLYESYVKDARQYIELAEEANGPIPKPVDDSYPWGEALREWERIAPDLRIINLETAVTVSEDPWPEKGIHYRMHPDNVRCLTAAGIDACALANNHVLDWGYSGLFETIESLKNARMKVAGAGGKLLEAERPAILEVPGKGRVLLVSFGSACSGIPVEWAASKSRPGVCLLEDLSDRTVREIRRRVQGGKEPGDIVVASIHWGGNWGYDIPKHQQAFARSLIDEATVDVIHGHSSHHPKGIEVYRGKPILYGCGDFIDDYEGIRGYEAFRDDLVLMYFLSINPLDGMLTDLTMTPLQIRNFRLQRPIAADVRWLWQTLDREAARLGSRVRLTDQDSFQLIWD